MSEKKPVVVYGVSGYTGRLVCEYLREYNIPFIAAGRDAAKVKAVVEKIPGIETADYEIAEVEHTVEALTKLFKGAQVVSNMVGPFIKYGPEVVEACLAAGCHYTDTTGEQDWVLLTQERWGAKFAAKGLLLAPNIAQMYTTGEIAANICLETPGLDTLDILVLWKGFPTYASTQTIFTILKANWYYLVQNKFVEWDVTANFEVNVPGQHEGAIAVPWGGTAHPVWFKNDPRVSNCRVLGGVMQRDVMLGVVQTQQMVKEKIKPLPADQQEKALADIAATVQATMPPRENPRINTSIDFGLCIGTARSRPLRDPRQLQLQADRNAAGLCCLLAAADCSQEGWLCLRLPGVRTSGTAGPVAKLRTGDEPNPDRSQLTQPGGACDRATRLLYGRWSMRLVDYLDKGASLGADAPCLTMDGKDLSYGDVQRLSYRIARGLANSGVAAGEKVAILSGNDPVAFACVFGISRAGAVWCPINPRNEAAENQFILDAFDCSLLLFHSSFAPMVDKMRPESAEAAQARMSRHRDVFRAVVRALACRCR